MGFGVKQRNVVSVCASLTFKRFQRIYLSTSHSPKHILRKHDAGFYFGAGRITTTLMFNEQKGKGKRYMKECTVMNYRNVKLPFQ